MRLTTLSLSLAALGLGTALVSTTASAQDYKIGRGENDGGLTTAQVDKGAQRTGSNSNREAFRSGTESYSFGAQGQSPRAAPNTYNTAQNDSEYKYPVGRNPNDGGVVANNANSGVSTPQFDKGAERTGSTSAREAFRSGTDTYAFGPQGQPPRAAPGAYGYTGGNTVAQRRTEGPYYNYSPNNNWNWNGQ
jgi:hypothetical protein